MGGAERRGRAAADLEQRERKKALALVTQAESQVMCQIQKENAK
jgi:hypothetical protein